MIFNLKTRPNVLFVSPQKIDSNSGYHIQWYAQRLQEQGARCVVAVPQKRNNEKLSVTPTFSYDEALSIDTSVLFQNGHGPDIVYAWTPREGVRQFVTRLNHKALFRLIVHLEDNEEHLTQCSVQLLLKQPLTESMQPFMQNLMQLKPSLIDSLIPTDRYHPIRGKAFLEKANGISYLIDTLSRFNANDAPSARLAAPADEALFHTRPLNLEYRRELGLADDEFVIVYAGNVHEANLNEVLDLYEAIKLLNAKGHQVTLMRTGSNSPIAAEKFKQFNKVISLGWLDRALMPDVLACANAFVQPGGAGPFNDERVPSKLPEFFALGRPVILARSNIGKLTTDRHDAMALDEVNATTIAAAVEALIVSPDLCARITKGARGFYETMLRADPQPMIDLVQRVLRTRALERGVLLQA